MEHHQKEVLREQIKTFTDREIQEKLLLETIESNRNIKRIMNNVVFFFWVALIGVLFTFIGYMNLMDVFKRM